MVDMAVMAVKATLLPRDGRVQMKEPITVTMVALIGIRSFCVNVTNQ